MLHYPRLILIFQCGPRRTHFLYLQGLYVLDYWCNDCVIPIIFLGCNNDGLGIARLECMTFAKGYNIIIFTTQCFMYMQRLLCSTPQQVNSVQQRTCSMFVLARGSPSHWTFSFSHGSLKKELTVSSKKVLTTKHLWRLLRNRAQQLWLKQQSS